MVKNLDELKLRIPKDVWLNELTVAEGKLITFNEQQYLPIA